MKIILRAFVILSICCTYLSAQDLAYEGWDSLPAYIQAPNLHEPSGDLLLPIQNPQTQEALASRTAARVYNSDIVFCKSDGIYTQNENGGDLLKLVDLTSEYQLFRFPTWSYDGSKIVFAAKRSDLVWDVIIVDLDLLTYYVIYQVDIRNTQFFLTEVNQLSFSYDNRYVSISNLVLDVTNSVSGTTIFDLADNSIEGFLAHYTYAAFEPRYDSYKLAFTGIEPSYAKFVLGVNDFSLTNNQDFWWIATQFGTIWGRVSWYNSSTLFSIVDDQYVVRFPRVGNLTSIGNADPGGTLQQFAAFDRTKRKMIISETTNGRSTLYKSTLSSNGDRISSTVSQGEGYDPSWVRYTQRIVLDTESASTSTAVAFSVYPNPTIDVLHVDAPGVLLERYQIIDPTGRVVQTGEINHDKISLLNLPEGLYIIRVYEREGNRVGTCRVIKSE